MSSLLCLFIACVLVSAGTERTLDCHAGYTLSSCSDLPLLWVTGTCLVLVASEHARGAAAALLPERLPRKVAEEGGLRMPPPKINRRRAAEKAPDQGGRAQVTGGDETGGPASAR